MFSLARSPCVAKLDPSSLKTNDRIEKCTCDKTYCKWIWRIYQTFGRDFRLLSPGITLKDWTYKLYSQPFSMSSAMVKRGLIKLILSFHSSHIFRTLHLITDTSWILCLLSMFNRLICHRQNSALSLNHFVPVAKLSKKYWWRRFKRTKSGLIQLIPRARR